MTNFIIAMTILWFIVCISIRWIEGRTVVDGILSAIFWPLTLVILLTYLIGGAFILVSELLLSIMAWATDRDF